MRRKWLKIMGGVILMAGIISGCDNQDTIGEEEILGYLENFTSLHPTENLMDFFDKEGVRDEHFRTSDKGVWYLNTTIDIDDPKEDILYAEGMHLRLNRNTGQGEGHFYKSQVDESNAVEEEQYPVIYDEDGFHLIEDIDDPVLEEKILNFRFIVQYMTLNEEYLSTLESPEVAYNPDRPLYHLYYEIPKDDPNLQLILENYSDYEFELAENTRMRIGGNGNYEGGALSDRDMELHFENEIRITASVIYHPEREDEE